ncbi:MAG: hypothetical protein F4215_12045 [Gemmatimonadetes bacterium]|nr:hypothetical protein [Gemmatimonadota bacterium]
MFYFSSYADRTKKNRERIDEVCKAQHIEYIPVELDIDRPADNWRIVINSIEEFIVDCQDILIDISTMPREIIWYILWLVGQSPIATRYVYHSPEDYASDWLSQDPRAPRLVYKLSGIALPSAKTALLITVGFDLQRVKRLINWYEPNKLMIGIQITSQFQRNDPTMMEYRKTLEKEYDCEIFELDAFAKDRGMTAIQGALEQLDSSYNIIMSSLGPKLTAITLYQHQKQNDRIGLVYAPSNQYNPKYSIGIGKCFEGTV